jgi:hypothetical protein
MQFTATADLLRFLSGCRERLQLARTALPSIESPLKLWGVRGGSLCAGALGAALRVTASLQADEIPVEIKAISRRCSPFNLRFAISQE